MRSFRRRRHAPKISRSATSIAKDPREIEQAFARLAVEPVDGLVVTAALAIYRHELAEPALRHRLPTIYYYAEHLDAGGLIAFGPDLRLAYHRTAENVHRILQGANPADMPVEQAKFVVGINLKTAKAIGVTVPQSLLVRADRVIE